jgi:uncharacterized membrane protein YbaN (DUF454 family)
MPAQAPRRLHPVQRWLWWLLAWLSLGLGVIGIVVPVLPTVPFILFAAFAAARGSERLHRYLLAHPRFAPHIRDWQVYGAVSRRAKQWASATMLASVVPIAWFAPAPWMAALPITCMALVAAWLWRRPEPPA